MKKTLLTILFASLALVGQAQIHYHCATMAEGQQLIVANTDYYNSLNQMDLDWRMRKSGTTREELVDFAKSCVQEFTDKEKERIAGAIAYIEKRLHEMGAILPFPKDDIVFIKTNMQEEGGAGAYTHKTEIYIGANVVRCNESKDGMLRLGGNNIQLYSLVAHELFHCLTRNSPEFRRDIYKLIGFTVMDKDIIFSPAIQQKILSNPDVEHIDNYAEFTIKGKKRKCELMVLYTHSWEEAVAEEGDDDVTFFDYNQSVLVPIDKPNKYYPIEEASDFWDVIGHNTEYVLAPEETLADNFSNAVMYGPGRNSNIASAKEKEESQVKYSTPQLIDDIILFLKSYGQKD